MCELCTAQGGERRLNVLMTRARERCVLFSSIRAMDIDLNRGRGVGVAALKTFLQYAETGQLDIAHPTGGLPGSPFEEEVGQTLTKLGHTIECQVGTAGFFLDIAVVDPENPGNFLLGIECDGATYHSSRSARDRDRLRQLVLEDRGWTIHRIWSTDWFSDPERELRKVVAAIEGASIGRPSRSSYDTLPKEIYEVDRQEPAEGTDEESGNSEYKEVRLEIVSARAPHEVSVQRLATIVTDIVIGEGPIHGDEVCRRVAESWGLKRSGSRIRDATRTALDSAERLGHIRGDEGFYSVNVEYMVPPRNRAHVQSRGLLKALMLPPPEIRGAIHEVVRGHVGAKPDDVAIEATRLFGFQRCGPDLRSVIDEQTRQMLSDGRLRLRDGRLYLMEPNE